MSIINKLLVDLIEIIVGCTILLCGTIMLITFWPIGILVQILGGCILLGIVKFYNFRDKHKLN